MAHSIAVTKSVHTTHSFFFDNKKHNTSNSNKQMLPGCFTISLTIDFILQTAMVIESFFTSRSSTIFFNVSSENLYVPEIVGGTDDTRNTKGKVIAYALREYGVDPKTAIMVGDREHDIHGAAENGIPAIGVTWGYGDRAELEGAGAKAVFDTPGETVDYILRGSF